MDNLLQNISIVILAIGIILMTVYITKASNNGFLTYEEREMSKRRPRLNPGQNIYNYRVNKEYSMMFSEQPAWLGYQYIDKKDREFRNPSTKTLQLPKQELPAYV